MSDSHPLVAWAARNGKTVAEIAVAAACSRSHLDNILAGRKEASLRLAKRLSGVCGGEVPMDAFLRPAPAEAAE